MTRNRPPGRPKPPGPPKAVEPGDTVRVRIRRGYVPLSGGDKALPGAVIELPADEAQSVVNRMIAEYA